MRASRTGDSIAGDLEAEFRTLPARTRLPSEQMVAERFGISRGAARGVIDGFRQRGLVRRYPGAGTIWLGRPEVAAVPPGVPSFSAWVRRRGDRPGLELQGCTSRRATKLEREYLGLDVGSTVWVVQRRLSVNDQLIGFATSVLPRTPLAGLQRAVADVGSLYQTLHGRYGLKVARSWQRTRPAILPPAVRESLRVTEPADFRLVESVNVTQTGAVEYARTYLRETYVAAGSGVGGPA